MKVRLSTPARRNLETALDYIASESPRVAARIGNRIEHTLDLLGEFPEMGRPGAEAGTREAPVPRTPYIIIYRIAEEVVVAAILHGRQNR